MTSYILFESDGDATPTVLVEVDEEEIVSEEDGLVKVGVRDTLNNAVSVASSTFSTAIRNAIHHNVKTITDAVQSLPNPPSDVEVSFGLKVTGEASNIAVGKVGGEVNYAIKLTWKQASS
ncbi:MAG: CU044_2847 family protein [Elainellaceae cyanobacterium]